MGKRAVIGRPGNEILNLQTLPVSPAMWLLAAGAGHPCSSVILLLLLGWRLQIMFIYN